MVERSRPGYSEWEDILISHLQNAAHHAEENETGWWIETPNPEKLHVQLRLMMQKLRENGDLRFQHLMIVRGPKHSNEIWIMRREEPPNYRGPGLPPSAEKAESLVPKQENSDDKLSGGTADSDSSD